MKPDQATALREPFPKSAIGKLPKGGVMLDYVGHAATTDRLLKVDAEWTWEPLALDAEGLPAIDKAGNLWIRLTVAGVTRIGCGDGKTMKERIGDAIRNAAMRFGVALDLWAKEDLHEISLARDEAAPAPVAEPEPAPTRRMSRETRAEPPDNAVTPTQLKKIGTAMSSLGMTERKAALTYVAHVVGRPVESRSDLTRFEAHMLIDALERDAGPADTYPPEETP